MQNDNSAIFGKEPLLSVLRHGPFRLPCPFHGRVGSRPQGLRRFARFCCFFGGLTAPAFGHTRWLGGGRASAQALPESVGQRAGGRGMKARSAPLIDDAQSWLDPTGRTRLTPFWKCPAEFVHACRGLRGIIASVCAQVDPGHPRPPCSAEGARRTDRPSR